MKIRSLTLAIVCLMAVCANPSFANDKINLLSQTEASVFYPPTIFQQRLDSGIQFYYVQDESLPYYEISVFVKAGRIHETEDKRGLADLFSRLWPLGGTTDIDSEALAKRFETLGAELDSDVFQEFIELHMRTLVKYQKESFELFFNLLKNPKFDDEKLTSLKIKKIAAIDINNDDPEKVARREFEQMLLGEKNPIAWQSTADTLQNITRDDLIGFYDAHVAPNQLAIVAKGPIAFLEFLQSCENELQDWKKTSVPDLVYPEAATPMVGLPTKQWIQWSSSQAEIYMGHLSVARDNPDKIKIAVLNSILGNGVLSSRLGNRIRKELGLAYNVSSQVVHNATTGLFLMYALAPAEQVMPALDEMRAVYQSFVENEDITQDEFENTKNKILNRSIFDFENSFSVAWQQFVFDSYGYDKDYLKSYYTTLQNMTLEEAKSVLKTYFHPDQLHVLVVGDKSKVKETSRLREFRTRELDKE